MKNIFILICVIFTLESCSNGVGKQDIDEIRSQIFDLERKVEWLENNKDDLEDKVQELESEIQELEHRISQTELDQLWN